MRLHTSGRAPNLPSTHRCPIVCHLPQLPTGRTVGHSAKHIEQFLKPNRSGNMPGVQAAPVRFHSPVICHSRRLTNLNQPNPKFAFQATPYIFCRVSLPTLLPRRQRLLPPARQPSRRPRGCPSLARCVPSTWRSSPPTPWSFWRPCPGASQAELWNFWIVARRARPSSMLASSPISSRRPSM